MRVTWLPFELHPEVPAEGIPRERYFGRDRAAQMEAHVREMGASAGLVMRSRDRLINTRIALGAAEFAREHGLYEAMHRALFEAHWASSARLEELEDVVLVGAGAGLDPDALRAALLERRYEEVLDRWRREATGVGINAIPAHVFGGRYLVLGAQPYEVFREVLTRLEEGAPR